MHEKSSQWKNQILNHSGVKLINNVFKRCKNYRTTFISLFFNVLYSIFVKKVIKFYFPQSLWRALRLNGGKTSSTTCLYKRTLPIRDMFHLSKKIRSEETLLINIDVNDPTMAATRATATNVSNVSNVNNWTDVMDETDETDETR